MTSEYRRDHEPFPRNDEFERLSISGRAVITTYSTTFETAATSGTSITPSEGERLALKRAMARFVMDSGIASARGWV